MTHGPRSAGAVQDRGATRALVELAAESWRLDQAVANALMAMEPFEAERFANQYAWYRRIVADVLDEVGLRAVDLTGRDYDVGMAVSPLNLEDVASPDGAGCRIAQMVEPIVMEGAAVRKTGSVMLEGAIGAQEE